MDANALARLKRLAGKQTVVLTHYGRKSGKPYEVKIWLVVDGDKVFIGTANVQRQWVQNVQKNPRIRLSFGGEKFEAEARFLVDPAERDRALAAMGRKYWMYSPVFALGKMLTAIGLTRNTTRTLLSKRRAYRTPTKFISCDDAAPVDTPTSSY